MIQVPYSFSKAQKGTYAENPGLVARGFLLSKKHAMSKEIPPHRFMIGVGSGGKIILAKASLLFGHHSTEAKHTFLFGNIPAQAMSTGLRINYDAICFILFQFEPVCGLMSSPRNQIG